MRHRVTEQLLAQLPVELADDVDAQALVEAGVTPAQLVYAQACGVSPTVYRGAFRGSVPHEEILEIARLAKSSGVVEYTYLLNEGFPKEDIIAVVKGRLSGMVYVRKRKSLRYTHKAAIATMRGHISDTLWQRLRGAGGEEDEIFSAQRLPMKMAEYVKHRCEGLGAEEVRHMALTREVTKKRQRLERHFSTREVDEVLAFGINHQQYLEARNQGIGHELLVEAHKAGIDILAYYKARGSKMTHKQAMKALVP